MFSGSTAGTHVEGTVVIPGTAPLQFNSSVQLQVGLGVIPLKTTSGNWVQRAIPTAITISATSTTGSGALVANQTNYVYAFDNAGVTALEFRTTAGMPHSPSTENGTEVATTDSTRTLVGMVRTNASTQFSDSATQRFTKSWFKPRTDAGKASFTANYNAATTNTFQELSTEIRNEFLVWSSQAVQVGASISNNVAAAASATSNIVFDTTSGGESGAGIFLSASVAFSGGAGISYIKTGLTEGYHFVTLTGQHSSAAAGTWFGDNVNGRNTVLTVATL